MASVRPAAGWLMWWQTVAAARTRLAAVQRQTHDAQSAIAGLLGAVALLDTGSDELDGARLRCLMTAELRRLQQLLAADPVEPIREFDLARAVGPVVRSHRLAGGRADFEVPPLRVLGRPLATATALANVLANVRAHATGARVEVRGNRLGDRTTLTVSDDGPGIPAADRRRLLARGERGTGAGPGSGIGLFSVQATMTEQSGSVHLSESPRGGLRVQLSLPAAPDYAVRAS